MVLRILDQCISGIMIMSFRVELEGSSQSFAKVWNFGKVLSKNAEIFPLRWRGAAMP